ncbi:hypothetical protein ACQ4PT_066994 [Festuca glaucescens]
MMDYSLGDIAPPGEGKLFDHQPLIVNNDDYERVQHIPVEKGENFRDLKGVMVGANKAVKFDPDIPRIYLSSGKPLNIIGLLLVAHRLDACGGMKLSQSFVVTRAEPHNQIILHPTQHRVLTIRENARLPGFPDYYRLFGPLKQKYMQVGKAVVVPVARALGYSLAKAYRGECDDDQPVFELPDSLGLLDRAKATRSSAGTPSGEVLLRI